MKTIRAHILVSGKVQGVGYRFWTVHRANQLSLNGWVRNLPDGRVEALFEGEQAVVEQMIRDCQQGPKSAVVKEINVELNESKGIRGFEVRY